LIHIHSENEQRSKRYKTREVLFFKVAFTSSLMSAERVRQRNLMVHTHQQRGQGISTVPRFDERDMTAFFNNSSSIDDVVYL